MIKAILFDFDKTLTDGMFSSYVDRKHLESLGLSSVQIDIVLKLDKEAVDKYYSGEVSKGINTLEKEKKLYFKVYTQCLKKAGVKNLEFVRSEIIKHRMEDVRFIVKKETYSLLEKLRKKYKLTIFSNALPSRDREIKSTRLDKYVDKIYISNFIGLFKPQIEFFEYVAKDLAVKLSEMLLVDDKLSIVEKVNKQGIHAVLIDKKGKYRKSKLTKIKDLSELLTLK